jgi:hypothetical protein
VSISLLQEYAKRLAKDPSVHQLLLIAHEELVQLYEKAGFEYRGKSPVAHGARPWFELRWVLQRESSSVPPGLLEALSKRPEAKAKFAFDKINEQNLEISSNPHDLLCPRPGCGSVILKQGVGTFHLKANNVDVSDCG